MKTNVYIASTYDNMIARENGGLDWLPGAQADSPELGSEEDFGFVEFFKEMDVIIMGRNTFEKILSFGQWPYMGKKVVIMSQSLKDLNSYGEIDPQIELSSETPAKTLDNLKAKGYAKTWIDGGRTIMSFLEAGLVDKMVITKFPILIGDGIPLFKPLTKDIHIATIEQKHYQKNIIQETIYFTPA